jgi:methylenetetrahydrofolate reductase (NADPH)
VKIRELFRRGRPLVSFEFFPPKTAEGEVTLMRTIEALRPLEPAFVSVTRTGGKPREAPVEIGTRIRALGIEAAAHVTCIEASRDELARHCELVLSKGIENLVTIRGDRPPDPDFQSPADGFRYAVEMIRFIRDRGYDLCLLGAGHPEGHPECRDLDRGMEHLRQKVDAGLDVVVTQLFYDNDCFFRFVDRARAAGVEVPIVAGFMPITNVAQIRRITQLSGNTIPAPLQAALDDARDDPAKAMAVGIDHGTRQCAALLRGGVAGIHFYTLNQSPATRAIFENLRAEGLLGDAGH